MGLGYAWRDGCLVVGGHERVMSRRLWQRARAASREAHQAAPT